MPRTLTYNRGEYLKQLDALKKKMGPMTKPKEPKNWNYEEMKLRMKKGRERGIVSSGVGVGP